MAKKIQGITIEIGGNTEENPLFRSGFSVFFQY